MPSLRSRQAWQSLFCVSVGYNGNDGHSNTDGSCSCLPGFAGEDCSSCDSNHFGAGNISCHPTANCQHGHCSEEGQCLCFDGWAGPECHICDIGNWSVAANNFSFSLYGEECEMTCQSNSSCDGHGDCTSGGSCSCFLGFDGEDCSSCFQNFFRETCSITCDAHTCGRGRCNDEGQCECEKRFQ